MNEYIELLTKSKILYSPITTDGTFETIRNMFCNWLTRFMLVSVCYLRY